MAAPQVLTNSVNFDALRGEFPALAQKVHGRPLAFLDSAASAQKPRAVLEIMRQVQETHYANVHRGVYSFSQCTTEAFENARKLTAGFLGAASDSEIVFTRNATEAINLVAASWGGANLKAGDEIILTQLEHHANIVPWQLLQGRIGFTIKVAPLNEDGSLDLAAYKNLLSEKTRLVAVSHMSNALGTILPVKEMTRLAKQAGAVVLIDGSQAVVHQSVNVRDIGCDFYVFTGHKLYGPTGIGVLWGRYEMLEKMPPYQGGGEMIERVSFDGTTFKKPPARFEAGTPAIVQAIGLGAAIEFVQALDMAAVQAHEAELLRSMTEGVSSIPGVRLFGTAKEKASILSFALGKAHPHDVGTILDQCGVAVRAGHHCTQPLMQALGVTATVRASLAVYNNKADVDALVDGLQKARKILGCT